MSRSLWAPFHRHFENKCRRTWLLSPVGARVQSRFSSTLRHSTIRQYDRLERTSDSDVPLDQHFFCDSSGDVLTKNASIDLYRTAAVVSGKPLPASVCIFSIVSSLLAFFGSRTRVMPNLAGPVSRECWSVTGAAAGRTAEDDACEARDTLNLLRIFATRITSHDGRVLMSNPLRFTTHTGSVLLSSCLQALKVTSDRREIVP